MGDEIETGPTDAADSVPEPGGTALIREAVSSLVRRWSEISQTFGPELAALSFYLHVIRDDDPAESTDG